MTTDQLMKLMRDKYGLSQSGGWKNGLTLEKLLRIVSKDDRAKLTEAFAKDKRYKHIN